MENKETIISNNFDIIDVAKSIAKEKGITSEEVLEAMEQLLPRQEGLNMVLSLI